MTLHQLGRSPWEPLFAFIVVVADKLLLLGVNRDDRKPSLEMAFHRSADLSKLRVSIGVIPALLALAVTFPRVCSSINVSRKLTNSGSVCVPPNDCESDLRLVRSWFESHQVTRYLTEFQYRVNRRYDLAGRLSPLSYVSLRTPPMPYKLLKLVEASV